MGCGEAWCVLPHAQRKKSDPNPDALLQRFGCAMKTLSSAIFKPKQFVVEEKIEKN